MRFVLLFALSILPVAVLSQNTIGFYQWTYSGVPSTGPIGANLGISFSGFTDVNQAINSYSPANVNTPKFNGGKTYLTIGGGIAPSGQFDVNGLSNFGSIAATVANAGYDGIMFDIEVFANSADQNLVSAFANAFAATKGVKAQSGLPLDVAITTSYSSPFGASPSLSLALVTAWAKDTNIDIISPQMYTTGMEPAPQNIESSTCPVAQTANGCYALLSNAHAKIVPSIVNPSHYASVQSFLATKGLITSGFITWQQLGSNTNLPPPTAVAGGGAVTNVPGKYTVMSGDTCFAIAQKFQISLDMLLALNNGVNCQLLQIGQVLIVTGSNTQRPTQTTPSTSTTTATTPQNGMPAGAVPPLGGACNTPGQFTCGPNNAAGQGSIVQCVGGQFVKIDDCNADPNNACTIIGGLPFCVQGRGIIGVGSPNLPPTLPPFLPTTLPNGQCASQVTHTVVAGDTCSAIAAMFNVGLDQLVALNPTCGNNLAIGTVLCIPNKAIGIPNTPLSGNSPTPVTRPAVGGQCIEGTFSCGPLNAIGQGSIDRCAGGVNVHIADCNDDPNNACKLFGGQPFCVAGKGTDGMFTGGATAAPGGTVPTPAPTVTPVVTAAPVPIANNGACTTEGQFACGPINEIGQGSIVQCVGGKFVKIDDCNEDPNNACTLIGGSPFCVLGKGIIGGPSLPPGQGMAAPAAPTTPAPANFVTMTATPPPTMCNQGQFSCGPINAMGQGTIVQCIANQLVHIDACNDDPNNACQVINGTPVCVLGKGTIGVTAQSVNTPVRALAACQQGTYSCGMLDAAGHGTITQCIGTSFMTMYTCSQPGATACQVFSSGAYCVNGAGYVQPSLQYSPAYAQAPTQTSGGTPAATPYMYIYIGAGVAFVVVVAIVAGIVISKRRNNPTTRV